MIRSSGLIQWFGLLISYLLDLCHCVSSTELVYFLDSASHEHEETRYGSSSQSGVRALTCGDSNLSCCDVTGMTNVIATWSDLNQKLEHGSSEPSDLCQTPSYFLFACSTALDVRIDLHGGESSVSPAPFRKDEVCNYVALSYSSKVLRRFQR